MEGECFAVKSFKEDPILHQGRGVDGGAADAGVGAVLVVVGFHHFEELLLILRSLYVADVPLARQEVLSSLVRRGAVMSCP